MLHPIGKQVYKLEFFKKLKMHIVFYISLLEQDITKKRRVDENVTKLDASKDDSEEYKVEVIWKNEVYIRESEGYPPRLYYLVSYKRYLEEENI